MAELEGMSLTFSSLLHYVPVVMTKQLDKIDRYLGKILEHKDMSSSCSVLRTEVKEFVAKYREEMTTMDAQGKELMETYSKILVSIALLHHYA